MLETPRLTLRLPEPADAEALMRIHQDPEALKHVHHGAGSEGLAHASRRVARVISLIEPDNLASIRVAEKLGEQVEGADHFNGKDVLRYVARRR